MKKSFGAKDAHLSHTGLVCGIVRYRRESQRDDHCLGRHLLLEPALRDHFPSQGHLYLWQYHEETGLHTECSVCSVMFNRPIISAWYPDATSNKFKETGLTPVKSALVDAPYVGEFPMVLECKVIHHYEIGLHTHFVGEILDVKVDENVLSDNGMPDIEKISPFVYAPEVQRYHSYRSGRGKGV